MVDYLRSNLPTGAIPTYSYTLPNGETVELTAAAAIEHGALLAAGFAPVEAPTHPACFGRVICTAAERSAELTRAQSAATQRRAPINQLRSLVGSDPSHPAHAVLVEIEVDRAKVRGERAAIERDAAERAERERTDRAAAKQVAEHRQQIALSRWRARNASALAAYRGPTAEQREADWRRLYPGAAARADRLR